MWHIYLYAGFSKKNIPWRSSKFKGETWTEVKTAEFWHNTRRTCRGYKKHPFKKQPTEVFCKKAVLKNFAIFTGKLFRWSYRPVGLQLYKKETPTQVFSCKHCEICKNIYFQERLRVAASGFRIFFPSCSIFSW